MASITFGGPNKDIFINMGALETDVTLPVEDIYSAWKDWLLVDDNTRWLQAMRSVGGDELGAGERFGYAFLLMNNWKICPVPQAARSRLRLVGNLFAEPYTNDVVDNDDVPAGNTILVEIRTSALPFIFETDTSGLTAGEAAKLASLGVPADNAAAVWAHATGVKVDKNTALIPATL